MIDPELAKLPDSKFAGTWGGWLNVIEGKKSFMKEQAFTAYFTEGSGEDSAFTLSMTGLALAVSAFAF